MPESLKFSPEQKSAYRSAYAPGATDEQFNLFITECERRSLVPGVHVVFQVRPAQEWNAKLQQKVKVEKVALITTINALRLIAERSGKYEGHGPFKYYYSVGEDQPLVESVIPRGRIPHAVSVEGYRTGWKVPLFATARYDAYVQLKGEGGPTKMWATRGEEQLAKCAEAQMLRTVAPEECEGLYLDIEMPESGEPAAETTPAPNAAEKPVVVPTATVAPAVNQKPAETVTPEKANTILEAATQAAVERNAAAQPDIITGKEEPVPVPKEEKPAPVQETPKTSTVGTQTAAVVNPEETPATPAEYNAFVSQRASKLVRDKLPKGGVKEKDASNLIKDYLLKNSGKKSLRELSAPVFERLLKVLEDATPEQAAEIVKGK